MKDAYRCLLLVVLLCVLPVARAEVPQISGSLYFERQGGRWFALASGEYERLVTLLPFSGVAPSASEWQSFAGNFSTLSGGVQTRYAVAYWTGSDWCLAGAGGDAGQRLRGGHGTAEHRRQRVSPAIATPRGRRSKASIRARPISRGMRNMWAPSRVVAAD